MNLLLPVENDSSKELLVTSDSNNALRRNYTRRPSLSRLTPYSPPMLQERKEEIQPNEEVRTKPQFRPKNISGEGHVETLKKTQNARKNKDQKLKSDSGEDVNVGDLGFFDEAEKEEGSEKKSVEKPQMQVTFAAPTPPQQDSVLTRLDKSLSKLEKVIDGAALLRVRTCILN